MNNPSQFLANHLNDPDERRVIVENALFGSPVITQINWTGTGNTFAANLVRVLTSYGTLPSGKPALMAVLESLKSYRGVDVQAEIDQWLIQLHPAANVPDPDETLTDEMYVFISYARPDQPYAEALQSYLEKAGVRVFRDTKDIKSGADWDMTIETALQETHRMVLLLSEHSMPYRKEVHREWFYFDQKRKPIYGLYVGKCELHSRLYSYNYIDCRGDFATGLSRLLTDMGVPFDPPTAMPEPPVIPTPEAEAYTLPQAFELLRDAVLKDEYIALKPEQITEMLAHKPANLTEYYLARMAEWSQPRYALDKRFVYLTLLLDKGEEEQERFQQVQTRFDDLRDVLGDRTDDHAFVVLGAPGSGKSTLLRRFQMDHCRDRLRGDDDTVSFFIQLNLYRGDTPPREWLNGQWRDRYPNLPRLDDLLRDGKAVLLLDALNEMPHTSPREYHEKVAKWRTFTQETVAQGNRVIYSCRSLDYSASLSSKELRVPQIQVQPMTAEQVREFLEAYLPKRAADVWEALNGTPQFDIFRTPYFLKLLVDQVETRQQIPTGRAALFAGFIRGALEREINGGNPLFSPNGLLTDRDHRRLAQQKWRTPSDLPSRGLLIPKLSELAFAMQKDRDRQDGGQVLVDFDDACDLLDTERDEDILKAGVSLAVLDEDANLNVKFFHQLLQEFFAARQLAEQPDPELVRVEWRADLATPTIADELTRISDNEPLPPPPTTGWEETTVLAAALSSDADTFIRGLIDANLPLAGRSAAAADVNASAALKDDLRRMLVERTQNPTADLRHRITAGLVLGELGDPRFERTTGPHGDYLTPPLVKVPAGTYPIGRDNAPYDREEPAHTVDLETFEIGQFAVTNAEYALFMAAGGYDDPQWWDTPEAEAWRNGEGSNDGPKNQWRTNKKTFENWTEDYINDLVTQNRITSKQAEDWITIRNWSNERFEEWLEDVFPSGTIYKQPGYWDDSAYNNPNQPVVGVSWYEARAYCNWLAAQTGQSFRLSTEAEWEAAARSTHDWEYPYEGDFDSAKSNTFETHLRRPASVGVFPDGKTESEIFDMSGNSYDWTSTIYDQENHPYPYQPDDGRENKSSTARRVLRGGSFDLSHSLRVFRVAAATVPVFVAIAAGFVCVVCVPFSISPL